MRIKRLHMGEYYVQLLNVQLPNVQMHQFSNCKKIGMSTYTNGAVSMITQQNLIYAYGDWIIQEFHDGRRVYYMNLMFEPLKGGSNAINFQMHSIIENVFYPELCGQLDHHPHRPGRNIRPTPQGLLG
jgi:hypothetical protein